MGEVSDRDVTTMRANRPFSLGRVSNIRALLIQAGYRENRHFRLYLGIRVLITVVALGAALLASGLKSSVLLFSVPTLAFYITEFALMRMVRDRQKRIRFGLIDALDLTVLCVETGLLPLQAIEHAAGELEQKRPDLCQELHLVCHEMRAGGTLDEALYSMSERTGLGEISEMSEMVRAEPIRFSEILRNCAHVLRVDYSRQAKPRKMALALVVFGAVFVFPMILIITLGPTLIELYRTLTS